MYNELTQLLLVSLIISMFCIGLRIISTKGMLLYFLRKPYDWLSGQIKSLTKNIDDCRINIKNANRYIIDQQMMLDAQVTDSAGWIETKDDIHQAEKEKMDIGVMLYDAMNDKFYWSIIYNVLKPIIGCCTCMASFWTIVWYPIITGGYDWCFVLVMFAVAFLNSVGMALYELIESNIKDCNCK